MAHQDLNNPEYLKSVTTKFYQIPENGIIIDNEIEELCEFVKRKYRERKPFLGGLHVRVERILEYTDKSERKEVLLKIDKRLQDVLLETKAKEGERKG